MSDWNLAAEAMLEHDLTVAECRLYVALMRELLGWKKREDRLGEHLLRRTAHLDGRSFKRARTRLVDRGLIDFQPGTVGRGHRSLYRLRLENPALQRVLENPAPERVFGPENPAEIPAENPALLTDKTPPQSGYALVASSKEQQQTVDLEGEPTPEERERTAELLRRASQGFYSIDEATR